jgi:DNA-binding transcriptional regulator YhcF (GntR family)
MPESTDRLSYKFQRLREAIRQAVTAGELGQKLPGERELARQFGVNAKTISKALTDLTSEGLLVRQVGRGTFVAGGSTGSLRPAGKYLWLSSKQTQPADPHDVFSQAMNRMKMRGIHIESQVVITNDEDEIPDRCLPISQLRDMAGILIYSSTPSVQFLSDLARRHIPAVLCNTVNPKVKTNHVGADFVRGGYELTEHLILLGHRRIKLLVDVGLVDMAQEFRRGHLAALTRYNVDPMSEVATTPGGVVGHVSQNLQSTALVGFGGHLCKALRVGFDEAIPERLAISGMAEPGFGGEINLNSYEVYSDQLVDWAVQLLLDASPGSIPRQVIVPGIFRDRGSALPSQSQPASRPQHAVL